MDILLLSNGKAANDIQLMGFAKDKILSQVQRTKVRRWILIPYAVIRSDYDERVKLAQSSFDELGVDVEVVGLHHEENKVKAIEGGEGIIVSGGNTWVLNKALHDLGLVNVIRHAVLKRHVPYIGWSAGTNVACPTIRTTNDMPIVTSVVLSSLNLVPFQINPHYIEAKLEGHQGETRDERIEEFLLMNHEEYVVGLPEGTGLHYLDGKLSYFSHNDAKLSLFRYGVERRQFLDRDNIQFLLNDRY